MKVLPSTSTSRAPYARLMKRGDPPTDLKARTGLSTPPGRIRCARANRRRDRSTRMDVKGRTGRKGSSPPALGSCERSRSLASKVRDHDVGAGAANAGEALEHRAAFVDPAVAAGRLQHRVLA